MISASTFTTIFWTCNLRLNSCQSRTPLALLVTAQVRFRLASLTQLAVICWCAQASAIKPMRCAQLHALSAMLARNSTKCSSVCTSITSASLCLLPRLSTTLLAATLKRSPPALCLNSLKETGTSSEALILFMIASHAKFLHLTSRAASRSTTPSITRLLSTRLKSG